jgi:hypothetical protein
MLSVLVIRSVSNHMEVNMIKKILTLAVISAALAGVTTTVANAQTVSSPRHTQFEWMYVPPEHGHGWYTEPGVSSRFVECTSGTAYNWQMVGRTWNTTQQTEDYVRGVAFSDENNSRSGFTIMIWVSCT